MKIRIKLALKFLSVGASVILVSFIVIYLLSSFFRESMAQKRMENLAITYARLLLDKKLVDANTLNIIDQNTEKIHLKEEIFIYNRKLEIVYSNFDADSGNLNPEMLEKIRLNNKYFFKRGSCDGVAFIYQSNDQPYYIISTGYDEYGIRWMLYLENTLIISYFACLVLLFISGYYYAGRSLRPITRIVKEVEEINISKLNSRLKVPNAKDEIGQLTLTFNNLLQRIENAFEMQRQFVSNASHELRTPLTRLTSEIEVTLIKDRSVDEYISTLQSLHEDLKIMNSLAHGLLELAHSNVDASTLRMTEVRIDEILFQARTDILRQNEDYQIKIEFAVPPEEESNLVIRGNENLLRIAFMNIMDNACKFSSDHLANVIIESFVYKVIIKCKDKGIGIPESELEKIWEPFYRAENTKNFSGHGIGLPLIKKIVELHNGEIKINSALNLGSEVIMILPYGKGN